jgi:hypothetical protein
MVATFGTNDNNDIYLGITGNLVVLKDLPAIEGACETASKAQLGEMVLAVKQGIPNFQTVWVGTPNFPLFQSYLRNALLGVAGVQNIKSIELSTVQNTLKYTAKIETQFGIGVLNG